MGTNFAKLMGQIEELKINSANIEKQLEINFTTYEKTIKQLTLDLDNSALLVETINQKNILEIKDIFKKIVHISKKELEIPLKSIKKICDQLENRLNKIIEQIKLYNTKAEQESKTILNSEENKILAENIEALFSQIENQKNKLNHLFDNLFIVQEKISHIKQAIEQYDAIKEETKIAKQINYLISKAQAAEHLINGNNDVLLEQLENLVNIIKSRAAVEETIDTATELPLEIEDESQADSTMKIKEENKSLLNQFSLHLTLKEQTDPIAIQENTTESTIIENEILSLSPNSIDHPTSSPRISL